MTDSCGAGPMVYPRVCGGTFQGSGPVAAALGLSPRMRGNLARRDRIVPQAWSIPAYAGEPW